MPGSLGTGFRRLSEDPVFDGEVFSVRTLRVADPNGAEFRREVVVHPGAVSIVAVDDEGTATLVRQVRVAVGGPVLETPAGTCDVDGEDAESTASRELAEEAGLRAARIERLGDLFNSPGYTSQVTTVYLATGLSACETSPAGAEERWMSTEQVPLAAVERLVAAGRLRDATTIAGLLLARTQLGTGEPGPPGR